MSDEEIITKLKAGEGVGEVEISQLYRIAKLLNADTTWAKRARGRGFEERALWDAISEKIEEMKKR